MSATKLLVTAVTDPPCIASNAADVANPVPTAVTVVPTAADEGLTTVTAVVMTVNGTELKPRPAAIVWRPADAETTNETVFVLTSGQV